MVVLSKVGTLVRGNKHDRSSISEVCRRSREIFFLKVIYKMSCRPAVMPNTRMYIVRRLDSQEQEVTLQKKATGGECLDKVRDSEKERERERVARRCSSAYVSKCVFVRVRVCACIDQTSVPVCLP